MIGSDLAQERRPPSANRHIGLLGGTFDPIHLGHVIAAQRVAEAESLRQVWFVVANDPWQKSSSRTITPAPIRLEMVRRACDASRAAGLPLDTSDVELQAGGPSYTAETVRRLRSDHPDCRFSVIVGSDAAAGLGTWHDAAWLQQHVEFLVIGRPGLTGTAPAGFRLRNVDCPVVQISSTDIRERVRDDLPVRHLIPAAVSGLIAAHRLYVASSP